MVAAIVSATRKSATSDETPHIGAGLSYWKTGDFRLNPEHPPLVKALSAGIALVAMPVDFQVFDPGGKRVLACWEDGDQVPLGNIMLYRRNDADRLLFWTRMAPILIGLAGGWAAWWWGRKLSGPWAGFCALAFLLLYPEYVGHARWVTFDVPVVAACGWISAALWGWWRRPTWRRAMLFGVAVALGALVKLTVAVYVVAASLCLVVVALSFRGLKGRRGFARVCVLLLAAAAGTYVAIWAAYGFRFSYLAPGQPPLAIQNAFLSYPDSPENTMGIQRWTRPLRDLRLLPEGYLAVLNHTGSFEGRRSYLNGVESRTGFYSYFLWTTLYKTPLAYILLGGVAALYLCRGLCRFRGRGWRPRAVWRRDALLLFVVPFLFLFLATTLSRANLGHRYVLFVYLPWCVGMGIVVGRWLRGGRIRGLGGLALASLAIAIAVNLRAYPDYATYFNPLGGSPLAASEKLLDSNTDWGQDLPAAAEFIRENDLGEVNLAYFGSADPSYYGIRFRHILPSYPFVVNFPPDQPPDPSRYTVVSLNTLSSVKLLYPGLLTPQPIAVLNSIVVYPPVQ